MTGRTNTHAVELGPTVVVKRFRSHDQDRHGREWRALTLLAEHAPGLAPEPALHRLGPTRKDRGRYVWSARSDGRRRDADLFIDRN